LLKKFNKQFYNESWFLETIMNNIKEAVTVTDLEERIIYVNGATEELFGYTKEEMIGKDPSSFNAEVNSNSIQKEITKTISSGGTWNRQIFNKKKNGELFLLSLKVKPLKNNNGEILGFIAFQEDISEKKKSEDTLKKLAVELQQSNFELEQFAYIASHDLQEPVRVISSYCQLLKESHYNDIDIDGKKYIDYTIDATIRMKNLINDLLNFSMAGRKDQPFEDINIFNLIKEIMIDYEMAITDTGSQVIIENDFPVIFAVHLRIKQLLSNLISNALKFHSDKNPIIRIGCYDKGDSWLFYVKDNGIGIKSKDFDKIFGVLKRLYSRDEYPGTGIGLALCKRIVENHDGKIWVDSKLNEGTKIYFTISKNIEVDNSL